MKENSIEKDEEILNNIKAYMQENIDNGFHKFIYNDLGYDEKCVDVINAIEHILSDYKRVLKENEELKNNTRKNENELEFDIDCDWIALQKMLDESEKSNEYISYKNEKWIKEKYCIPIQKVKDKIEELKEDKDSKYYDIFLEERDIENTIKILQELLDNRK